MEDKGCTGQAMEDRLTDFAASIADLYEALPRTFFGRHYGQQILRAGTASAANYAEVRAANECLFGATHDIFSFSEEGLDRALKQLQNALQIIGDNATSLPA